MSRSYMEEYKRWLASDRVDEATKAELRAMEGDEEAIRAAFYGNLEFGTGGLRGVMRAGTFSMNIYTVAQATQGLADLILREGKADRGVIVGCDSRNNSAAFARATASVLAANGIKVYCFDELRPTPMVSFAIRELNCIAGVNITASHNPSKYNGYKAYWEDGAQLAPEQADVVSACINSTDIFDGVKICDYDEAVAAGKITILPRDFDDIYLGNVLSQMVNPALAKKMGPEMQIVYTPLHGAGYRVTPEALRRAGFTNITTVSEQMTPNGDFPTVAFPNPEYKEVFELGIALANRVGSDLIVANDPDADRTGIMVRSADGSFVTLTGNQVGALLLDYIITAYKETGTMPEEPYAVKTIVTTDIAAKICAEQDVKLYNVLTGFKFIGEVIKKYEAKGHGTFLFGFEESYGYLKGTYARDKDAVVATVLICEMAAYYKTKGMTLYDAMEKLYERYGYYMESQISVTMEGLDGLEKMQKLMERLRTEPPKELGGEQVAFVRDYRAGTIVNVATGASEPTGLPSSNVLYYETVNGNVVVARPSGTEPKIKFYFLVHGATKAEAEAIMAGCKDTAKDWAK